MIKLSSDKQDKYDFKNKIDTTVDNFIPHFNQFLNQKAELDELFTYVQQLKDKPQHICIVGMGGSSLGCKAIVEALDLEQRVTFFDNVDAHTFNKKQNQLLGLSKHWFIISKSGQTQEVVTLLDFILQKDEKAITNMTVITSNNDNPLRFWAKSKGMATFFIPDDIGGRYSIFTPVGLLPLIYLGQDIAELKKGVNWALNDKKLLKDLTSQLYASLQRNEQLHLYWFYSDSLSTLGLWLQQLWMESLGKKIKKDGSAASQMSSLFIARGATDQHSLLQGIIEAKQKNLSVFVSDSRSTSSGDILQVSQSLTSSHLTGFGLGELLKIQCKATREALNQEQKPTMALHLEEVSLKSIAAFMTLYMSSVICIAEILNIDPYNQPGVESSKENTRLILTRLHG